MASERRRRRNIGVVCPAATGSNRSTRYFLSFFSLSLSPPPPFPLPLPLPAEPLPFAGSVVACGAGWGAGGGAAVVAAVVAAGSAAGGGAGVGAAAFFLPFD